MTWYRLNDDGTTVPIDERAWPPGESTRQRVGLETFPVRRHWWSLKHDSATVSTVFLSLDHGWPGGPPMLFETMVFGEGKHEGWCERYTTKAEAIAGHHRVVRNLKRRKAPDS